MSGIIDQIRQTGVVSMRFDSSEAWQSFALGNRMLQEDPDTGLIINYKGVQCITEDTVHALRPVKVTATYDEDGNQLTAPVYDSRYHVDVYLEPASRETDFFNQLAAYAEANGGALPNPNKTEDGLRLEVFSGELLDRSTFASPSHGFQ